jgi:hypothetical protein
MIQTSELEKLRGTIGLSQFPDDLTSSAISNFNHPDFLNENIRQQKAINSR